MLILLWIDCIQMVTTFLLASWLFCFDFKVMFLNFFLYFLNSHRCIRWYMILFAPISLLHFFLINSVSPSQFHVFFFFLITHSVQLVLPVCAQILGHPLEHRNSNTDHTLKRDWIFNNYQLLIALQYELRPGSLAGLILGAFYIENHDCCKFMSAIAMLCTEGNISCLFPTLQLLHSFHLLFYETVWAFGGGVRIIWYSV